MENGSQNGPKMLLEDVGVGFGPRACYAFRCPLIETALAVEIDERRCGHGYGHGLATMTMAMAMDMAMAMATMAMATFAMAFCQRDRSRSGLQEHIRSSKHALAFNNACFLQTFWKGLGLGTARKRPKKSTYQKAILAKRALHVAAAAATGRPRVAVLW